MVLVLNFILFFLLVLDVFVFIVKLFDLWYWQNTKRLHCDMLAMFTKVGVRDLEDYLNGEMGKSKKTIAITVIIFFVLIGNILVVNLL